MTKLNNTLAIIQGRMASSRLPGKVLEEIGGAPMLEWVVERTALARSVEKVVVATSTRPEDNAIAAFCKTQGYFCYRGSQFDLLDRYYQAAALHRASLIVRVTADCPLIDPGLIDQTVELLQGNGSAGNPQFDFTANRLPPPWGRTFPIGLDVEVCTFTALKNAWENAAAPHQREHVMPFLYENPGRFKITTLDHTEDYGAVRWTVDTPEDLQAIRALVQHLPKDFSRGPWSGFTWLDALEAWLKHPELSRINANIQHKSGKDTDNRAQF